MWIADQRRYYAAGTLEAARVVELEALGMVWSVQASAWDTGLDVARAYAAVHGHFVPPATVVWDSFPIGTWAKNQRAAARRARENTVRRAAGEVGVPSSGELSEGRMEALEDVDPGWCPEWEISWQRAYRLALARVKAGSALPAGLGEVLVQGEDLGAWIAAQRAGWEQLVPVQQYLLETLGIEPAGEDVSPARRSQSSAWERNVAAARQFHAREGHLTVPRKHVETVGGEPVRLGSFVDNSRRRATKLSPERRADLDALGMRW